MSVTHQKWVPDRYRSNAGFVAALGLPVVELLDPQAGETILDLGCGDGTLTAKLAEMGCHVIGIDASASQITQAQADGLEAYVMDAQNLSFTDAFDAVFSNAALHWMKDASSVIQGVRQALRPGGRFVGEFGGAGNVKTIQTALRTAVACHGIDPDEVDPWYFPLAESYRAKLEDAGFTVHSAELINRPTPLPGDIRGWFSVFADSFLGSLPETVRDGTIESLQKSLRPLLMNEEGVWIADYVRLRFSASLEG